MDRTAHVNQIRGLLAEFGLVMPSGRKHLNIRLPEILEDAENELTAEMRELISDCYQRVQDLSEAIAKQENRIKQLSSQNPLCERIEKIPGIGPLTASAFVATIGKALEFKNGRELSAFLGLVPRQHSSGGKQNLMGISKRGDSYLRTLLIHGARSMLRFVRATPEKNPWLSDLMLRKNSNVASVALANKNVRIIWALLSKDMEFNPQHVSIAPVA
jgi:transposase